MNDTSVISNLKITYDNFLPHNWLKAIVGGSGNAGLRNDTFQRIFLPEIDERRISILVRSDERMNEPTTLFGLACKNNISRVVEYLAANCPVNLNLGTPTPMWHAANGGHEDVVKILVRYKDSLDFKSPPHHITPLMIVIAKEHDHLLPYFKELYGGDSFQVMEECIKFGKENMFLKVKGDIKLNVPKLKELMEAAIMSDNSETFDTVQKLCEESGIDKKQFLTLMQKRSASAKLKSEDPALPSSFLVEMSRRFPRFNSDIEPPWSTGFKPKRWQIHLEHDIRRIILKRFCCLLGHQSQVSKLRLAECSVECRQKTDCQSVRDLMYLCQELELNMQEHCPKMKFLMPKFFLIGSVAEGTRVGRANEADITMKFSGLESFKFGIGKNATELIINEDDMAREHLQSFCKEGTDNVFNYPKFLQFLLQAIESCLSKIDVGKFGLEVTLWNKDFKPCPKCIGKSENSPKSMHQAVTHCRACPPAICHTKLGPCLVLRRKARNSSSFLGDMDNVPGDGKDSFIVTIDLIPTFPFIENDIMKLMSQVIKTLVTDRPPFWLDYFNSLMKKDVILPEAFAENGEQSESRVGYVALKLLHYGPEPNYIIRPGQRMKIDEFHSNNMLKNIYVHMKAIKDLLKIDTKSYFMKKVLLLPDFLAKVRNQNIRDRLEQDRTFNTLLLEALSHPDIKPLFEDSIDFVQWNNNILKNFNGIPLVKKGFWSER